MGTIAVQNRATKVLYFVAGIICAPLLLVGVFRLMPLDWSPAIPFLGVLVPAVVLAWRPTSRALGLGLVVGSATWGMFLFYLWSTWSEGLQKI